MNYQDLIVEETEEIPAGFHYEETVLIIEDWATPPTDEEEPLTSEDELHLEEELRGRHIKCTCSQDPLWCELHGGWN